jgi:hypothetical protein
LSHPRRAGRYTRPIERRDGPAVERNWQYFIYFFAGAALIAFLARRRGGAAAAAGAPA